MTRLLSVMLFGAVLFFSSVASATTGYVCSTRRAMSSTYGSGGATLVTYYSAADCTGTLQGTRYYCSPGATNTLCASSSLYLYGGAELNAFFSVFHTAALEGARIAHYDTTCYSTGSDSCGGYFYAYGY